MDEWLRAWLTDALGAAVRDVDHLTGGMSTDLRLISTVVGRRAVLRRYPAPRWSAARARAAAAGEMWLLGQLADSIVPAPGLIAGSAESEPMVLMDFCPGSRYTGDGYGIAGELGRVLAAIHAVPVPSVASLSDESASTAAHLAAGRVHRYGRPGPLLDAVLARRPDRPTDRPKALVHNDFSLSNVLVSAGEITGVVDWTEAAIGDPVCDVAFCFVSTWLTYGEEVAAEFLAAYRDLALQPPVDLGWWVLVAASRLEPDIETWTESANYLGPADIDAATIQSRFTNAVAWGSR